MKVKSVMTRDPVGCKPEMTLKEAIQTMRRIDSGVLPVLEDGEPVGVVTDRDICLGLAERDRRPSDLTVRDAMSRGVLCCRERDGVRKALEVMRARRVRRLPVVDERGRLVGMVSINDVILHSEAAGDGKAVSYEDTIKTLQHICEHRYPVLPARPADVTELARSF